MKIPNTEALKDRLEKSKVRSSKGWRGGQVDRIMQGLADRGKKFGLYSKYNAGLPCW